MIKKKNAQNQNIQSQITLNIITVMAVILDHPNQTRVIALNC